MRNSFGFHASDLCCLSRAFALTLLVLPITGCGGGGDHSTPPPVIGVSITTRPVSVASGGTYTFVATVTNSSNKTVTWSLTCAQGVTACGKIGASTGLFEAPAVTAEIGATVKAVSSADTSKVDSWTFKVVPPPASVQIDTYPSFINAGLNFRFSATVTGLADSSVTWALACSPGVSNCGAIASDGTYTTPASVSQQSPFTVTATSVADATKSDSATVALLPPIVVAVSPGSVELVGGFSYPFSVVVQNDLANVGVTWTVNGVAGGNADVGTIAAVADPRVPSNLTGLYTAPAVTPAHQITITATSLVDTKKSSSATVSLISNPHPDFTGNFAFLVSGPGSGGTEAAGGILNLDGSGHLTGKLDVHVSGFSDQVVSGLNVTGSYGFDGADLGWATLTYSVANQSASMSFRIIFVSDTVAQVMEFDSAGGTMGTLEKQSGDFASALTGRNVVALSGAAAILGEFNGASGALTGVYDPIDTNFNHQSSGLTGSYTITVNSGTATLGVQSALSVAAAPTFFLYPVSSGRALLMSRTAPLEFGWIDKQSNDTFSTASLAGEWVFSNAASPTPASATLGRFTSNGLGTSAPGCIDSEGSSSFLPPACYPMFDLNSYTIDATGRGFAPQAQWGMPRPAYLYFIDANHGRFGSQGGLGEIYRVDGAPFSNSTLSGTFTIAFTGIENYFMTNATSSDEIGTIVFDGNGNATMTTAWNDSKDFQQVQGYRRVGTYAFDNGIYATGGRGVMVLGSDMQVVFYAVSPDKLFVIQFSDYDTAFGIAQRSVAPTE